MLIIQLTINNIICCTVDALQEITSTMGATYWKFNDDLCQIEVVGTTPTKPEGSESSVDCECNFDNSTTCRVVRMYSILILLVYAISLFISYTSSLLIILYHSNRSIHIYLRIDILCFKTHQM